MKRPGFEKDVKPFTPQGDPLDMVLYHVGVVTGELKKLNDRVGDIADNMLNRDSCSLMIMRAVEAHEDKKHRPAGLSPKHKQALISAIAAVCTGVAAFLTAKYGV